MKLRLMRGIAIGAMVVSQLTMLQAQSVKPGDPAAKESRFQAVVSADGSGTHKTVAEAIAAAREGGGVVG